MGFRICRLRGWFTVYGLRFRVEGLQVLGLRSLRMCGIRGSRGGFWIRVWGLLKGSRDLLSRVISKAK